MMWILWPILAASVCIVVIALCAGAMAHCNATEGDAHADSALHEFHINHPALHFYPHAGDP
jgi:hypothetical protein